MTQGHTGICHSSLQGADAVPPWLLPLALSHSSTPPAGHPTTKIPIFCQKLHFLLNVEKLLHRVNQNSFTSWYLQSIDMTLALIFFADSSHSFTSLYQILCNMNISKNRTSISLKIIQPIRFWLDFIEVKLYFKLIPFKTTALCQQSEL